MPTHCAFCGVQCGMYLRVNGGKVIGVEPRDYPHNRGSLCPKGVVAYQQQNHPERLRYPMIRRGGKGGTLERATWDEALDYIVGRWQAIQAEHGRDCGRRLQRLVDDQREMLLMGKFARVGLRTRHVDYNGRLCMSSAAGAYTKAFGIDRALLPMTDIPARRRACWSSARMWRVLPDRHAVDLARARPWGASLIVVDPRETPHRPHGRSLAARQAGNRHRPAQRDAARDHPRGHGR